MGLESNAPPDPGELLVTPGKRRGKAKSSYRVQRVRVRKSIFVLLRKLNAKLRRDMAHLKARLVETQEQGTLWRVPLQGWTVEQMRKKLESKQIPRTDVYYGCGEVLLSLGQGDRNHAIKKTQGIYRETIRALEREGIADLQDILCHIVQPDTEGYFDLLGTMQAIQEFAVDQGTTIKDCPDLRELVADWLESEIKRRVELGQDYTELEEMETRLLAMAFRLRYASRFERRPDYGSYFYVWGDLYNHFYFTTNFATRGDTIVMKDGEGKHWYYGRTITPPIIPQ